MDPTTKFALLVSSGEAKENLAQVKKVFETVPAQVCVAALPAVTREELLVRGKASVAGNAGHFCKSGN